MSKTVAVSNKIPEIDQVKKDNIELTRALLELNHMAMVYNRALVRISKMTEKRIAWKDQGISSEEQTLPTEAALIAQGAFEEIEKYKEMLYGKTDGNKN